MPENSFYEEGSRVLTPAAFAFVLEAELKRAVRAQTLLTLVVIELQRQPDDFQLTADASTVQRVAELVTREVRDTDFVAQTGTGTMSLVLLDANVDQAARPLDRVVSRISSYEFGTPLAIRIGAACFPTDATDRQALAEEAMKHPLISRLKLH